MSFAVWTQRLNRASADWESQGDDLHGAGKTLGAVDVTLLGSRVAPAATTFLTTWGDRIEALRRVANTHSASLSAAATDFDTADRDTVEGMQRLLSWEDRHARPGPPRRTP